MEKKLQEKSIYPDVMPSPEMIKAEWPLLRNAIFEMQELHLCYRHNCLALMFCITVALLCKLVIFLDSQQNSQH